MRYFVEALESSVKSKYCQFVNVGEKEVENLSCRHQNIKVL